MGEKEHGLTCATFVLAVFDSCGISLIDVESWPKRGDDKIWHEQIIQDLQRAVNDKEHINKIKEEIGCARFRPEEVAMSSTFYEFPAQHDDIQRRGKELKDKLINRK